ncbi:uncharacterized protein [Porites lutea]|uniref:uncharacterized protein n=1 Tax=Porites lutea TaxID=51062 RepID=UPI003CC5261A
MTMRKNYASSSTQFLCTEGGVENAKENLPLVGLNVPVFIGENSSSGEYTLGLPTLTKSVENGNFLQRSFSQETDPSSSSRNIARLARISTSSTATSPNTLFEGFQIPTETVIPVENVGPIKKKKSISAQDAIPILPRSAAIACLILNILIPGLGTVVSGLIAFFLTRREIPLKDRASILCVNFFVGIMQLTTIVFLMIGWIWSIVWGCAFVGLSEHYGKNIEKVEGGELIA